MVKQNAVVAQLVERLLAMQKVVSSNLISRSIKFYQTFLILKGSRERQRSCFTLHQQSLLDYCYNSNYMQKNHYLIENILFYRNISNNHKKLSRK